MLLSPYRVGLQQRDPNPYYQGPNLQSQQSLQDFLQQNLLALDNDYDPTTQQRFDLLNQANQYDSLAQQLNIKSSMNASNNAMPNLNNLPPLGGDGGSVPLRAILRALGAKESGNNYGAVNRDSGALGRWQVMPSNIAGPRGWDFEALGRNISTQDFLSNRKLQNAIVRYKFGHYLNQYGIRGALSAWYSGSPNKWNSKTPQGKYPSVHAYVMDILRRLGLG